MTRRIALLLLLIALPSLSKSATGWFAQSDHPATAQADPKYFHYKADITTPATSQAYVIVTPEIWRNATSDLRDLRLYNGAVPVPYALAPASGEEVRGNEENATILNLGRVNGDTQFVLAVNAGDALLSHEWIRLTLRDGSPDFVAKAHVEGFNNFGGTVVDLGTTTLFKLQKEKLGENLTVKFPPSVFRYLRVTIPSIDPSAITGAHVFSPGVANRNWTEMDLRTSAKIDAHDSVYEWDWPDTVPIGRVEFKIDSGNGGNRDFWRRVELRAEPDLPVATGAIWSVESRAGNAVANNDAASNFELLVPGETHSKHFKLIVHNGDDPPLKLTIRAAYRERRLYFAAADAQKLTLYFGDEKLDRPVYDYAKTWVRSDEASAAHVANVQPNPEYTGRADERPWSERHPAVIWIALAIAVIGLGAIALKSFTRQHTDGSAQQLDQGTGGGEQR
jgi:hypothetical protein